jgi:hypothetical protein
MKRALTAILLAGSAPASLAQTRTTPASLVTGTQVP